MTSPNIFESRRSISVVLFAAISLFILSCNHALRGDSVRAIVPSLQGSGNIGLPGKIPPGALLVLRVRQF